jgi:TonB family protein
MLRITFLRVPIICVALVFTAYAETPMAWKPIRVLGAIYPKEAQFAGIQGVVEAKCSVRVDGSVEDVVSISGHIVLARAVRSNLLQWKFQANEEGKLNEQIIIKYNFQLKGSCDNHKGCKQEFWFDYPSEVTVIAERPHSNTSSSEKPEKDLGIFQGTH